MTGFLKPSIVVTHISSVTDIGKMLVLVPRKLPVSTKALPGKGDSGFVPASVLTTCTVHRVKQKACL